MQGSIMPLDRVEIEGGEYNHHVGSSASQDRWLNELRNAYPNKNLVCAQHGCRAAAQLGAHVNVGF